MLGWPRPQDLTDAHDTGRGEQHQQGHQGIAVSRHHGKGDERHRVGGQQQIQQGQVGSSRPRGPDAEECQRGQHAKVPHGAGGPQQERPVGVAELVFGIGHFRRIPRQHELAAHELQPVPRLCPDVVERAPRPVPGHPARGQPSAGRLLGKIRGVLTLIPGVAATDAQRFVGTGGILVVADIEVRTKLRRGQIELTADHLVPGGHRQQDNRESSRQEPHQHKPPRREVSLVPEQPERDGTREHHRVLAGQHQTAKGQSDAKPRPPAIGFPHQPTQQRQQQTQQEDVEDRFLYETVEEDGWRIAGQHHPGHDPDRLREQTPPGECQQDTRERADDSLTQPHDRWPVAEHRVHQTEEIGIERRLIEDLAADDVAGRDLSRPRVIALCISHQQVENRFC